MTKSQNQTAYAPGTAVTRDTRRQRLRSTAGPATPRRRRTRSSIVVTSVSRNLTANFINVCTLDLTVIGKRHVGQSTTWRTTPSARR